MRKSQAGKRDAKPKEELEAGLKPIQAQGYAQAVRGDAAEVGVGVEIKEQE